jgi:hypothetical protein
MKLTEIFEIADRHHTNADCKACEIPYGMCFECTLADAEYRNTAPAMEAKLRDMVDMLPEIEKAIRRFNALRSASGIDTSKEVALLEKLKQWGE